MSQKDLAYYRSLPYRRRVRPEEDSTGDAYYVAWIEELPWIKADASGREDALYRLAEMFDEAIEVMLEAGDEIAEPVLWPESVGRRPARLKKAIRFFGGGPARAIEAEQRTVSAASEAEWEDVESTEAQTAGAA